MEERIGAQEIFYKYDENAKGEYVGISIVLGTYNRKRFLKEAIASVRKEMVNSNIAHEIIVVDGGSTDGSIGWLAMQRDIILVVQANRGRWLGQPIRKKSWGYFMNLGFKISKGKYICMISDDCLIIPDAIKSGYQQFESMIEKGKKVGAMAFYWRNWPSEDVYFVGLTLGKTILVNHGMYLRRAVEEVGFIDETSYDFYCADGDLCLRLRDAGYDCVDSKASFVEHFVHSNALARKENASSAQKDWQAYVQRWHGIYDQEEGDLRIELKHMDAEMTFRGFKKAMRRKEIVSVYGGPMRRLIAFLKSVAKKIVTC